MGKWWEGAPPAFSNYFKHCVNLYIVLQTNLFLFVESSIFKTTAVVVNKPIEVQVHSYYSSFVVVEMACKVHHPFTAVVAGQTGCGKSVWVLHLTDKQCTRNDKKLPSRIWYCYGEYKATFNNYPHVHFHEGVFDPNGTVFDGLKPTLLVLYDLMCKTNELVANTFTKLSHHSNVSVVSHSKLIQQELICRWNSERELLYDNISHVLQNTKKRTYFV